MDSKNEMVRLKACLRGDISSQKSLYMCYAPKMLGVCWRFSKTKEEAEDLLQDGFLRVFSDLGQYRGEGSFEGWMRRVIVNVALQHVRKKKLVFAPMLEVEKISILDNSHDQIFQKFEVQDLLKILQILPSGARCIFDLYVMEGYTHKEIAKELGISIGTSKSQLSKARSMLKAKIVKQNKIDWI